MQEYATDSNVSEALSDDEDELTFLRGIETSGGQMLRVVRPKMCSLCYFLMTPMKLLAKILFLHMRTTLKDCK